MSAETSATLFAAPGRVDRLAARLLRERERKDRGPRPRRASRSAVETYEALVDQLTGAHRIDFDPIDWDRIEAEGPMAPAVARDALATVARRRLAEYRPSMADSLLGRERDRRRELMARLQEAVKADAELYGRAKAAADAHNRMLALASEVRCLKVPAIVGVLKANGAAAALKGLVEGASLHAAGADRLVIGLDLLEFDALPDEACRAQPAGPAYAPLSDAERAEFQLAYACSASLRAAIEVLKVAPVEEVEVVARLCPPKAESAADFLPVLQAGISAQALAKGQLRKLDAAQAMAAFGARLAWTPSHGLSPIRLDGPDVTARRAA
jgi:hypothetical protein